MTQTISLDENYSKFLIDIKNQIKLSQQKAFNAVNQEMVFLYFSIGAMIDKKQQSLGWGAKVIDKLSADILQEFPNMRGFSTRNLKRMVRFYKEYQVEFEKVPLAVAQLENSKVQPAVAQIENEKMPLLVAQIPWTHNIILIQKIKEKSVRYWYMEQILQNGWSKDILSLMIKSELHK
ncbi:MAG: DUF1016 domain-containing protein, partial [Arcobacter butzleri]|nr:DUF1016 domain-containing protein [Aliarcobacter butzleri]